MKKIITLVIIGLGISYFLINPSSKQELKEKTISESEKITQVINKHKNSVLRVIAVKKGKETVVGNGFFIEGGKVLSNAHIFADGESDFYLEIENEKIKIKGLVKDIESDIAFIDQENIQNQDNEGRNISFAKNPAKTGEKVIALESTSLGNQLASRGSIVEKIDELEAGLGSFSLKLEDVLMTDILLHSGSSGSPLLNLDGELVGINTAFNKNDQVGGVAISTEEINEFLSKNTPK